jgi:spore coat assembly protein SafA
LKKLILPIALTASLLLPSVAFGAGTYKVVSGDTLWKVAVKNQVGITELISANSQVKNINMIYPGQSLNIPSNHYQSIEQQVVNLVNAERAKAGLKPLKADWELSRVARFKSEDMRDNRYFDHNSPFMVHPSK